MADPHSCGAFEGDPLHDDAPEVWERLIQALGPASMLVCIQERMGPRLRAAVAPEDIWQETLLYVWRDRATCEWRGIGAFRRWVLTIAENRLRNMADRIHTLRRGGGQQPARLGGPESSRFGDGPPPVASTTPSRIASFSEQARLMQSVLGELSDELRDVVRLRLFEERPVEQVARELNLGESAVKHRFRKGAALYHSRLTQLLGSEGT